MRTARPPPLQGSGRGTNGDLRLHRGLVQSAPPPLRPRLSFTDQLRKDSATTEFNRKPNTVHRSGVAPNRLRLLPDPDLELAVVDLDRKSTRLNSSHLGISY